MRYRSAPHNIRDAIEPEIVKALAGMGIEWNECGPLDGWVPVRRFMHRVHQRWSCGHAPLYQPVLVPVELKDPSRLNHKKGKFTKQQQAFIAYCERNNLPYFIWHSVDECLKDLTGK